MFTRSWLPYVFFILCTSFFCGFLGVLFGKELCWDLANYHYYNPFAYLNGREQIDVWPTTFIHQYLNPALDFLPYFLINHFSSVTTEFLLSTLHGVNFGLIFLIARSYNLAHSIWLAIGIALVGMYGPFALPGIGSFQNDHFAASFMLVFVWLQIIALQKNSNSVFFLANCMLGISFGLKFTSGIYLVGGAAALVLLPIDYGKKIKLLVIFCLGTICGLSLSAGFWMWRLWKLHHNPFFPFLNGIFHSADFPAMSWRDMRFIPHGWVENLFFPYFFSWNGNSETRPCTDYRFAIAYALLILLSAKILYQKNWRPSATMTKAGLVTHWFLYFFIFSYLAWQYYFANFRYLLGLEILCPFFIYVLLAKLIDKPLPFYSFLFVTYLFIIIFMVSSPMIRAPWYEADFFNIKLPAVSKDKDKAIVLLPFSAFSLDINPRPQAYLIPFFPENWQFVGIPFRHEKYLYDFHYHETLRSLIQGFKGKMFLLSGEESLSELYVLSHSLQLTQAGPCEKIISDRQKISNLAVFLCPIKGKTDAKSRI